MNPAQTAVVLVGLQNDYFAPSGALRSAIEDPAGPALANTIGLLASVADSSVLVVSSPIVFSAERPGGLDSEGILAAHWAAGAFRLGSPGTAAVAGLARFAARVVELPHDQRFDPFSNPGLDDALRAGAIQDLVLAGALTSLSVDSAARSAYEAGYRVWVLSDCTLARSTSEQRLFCERIFPLYAMVTDSHRLLESLRSGSDDDRSGRSGTTTVSERELRARIRDRVMEALHERDVELTEYRLGSALHDPLTGLASRTLLADHLRLGLARGVRSGSATAVFAVDIDDFRHVNDRLGHDRGDEVLVEVARRLEAAVRAYDTVGRSSTVARLGGDEFLVHCEQVKGYQGAAGISRRLADAISAPMDVAGGPISVTASMGVVLGREVEDPDELILAAELAMRQAKSQGPGRQVHFLDEVGASARQVSGTEDDLRRALAEGQLRLVYQPKVLLATGQIVGVEALLRWEHPERGTVGPDEFIPVAERSGLIVPIGVWVLEQACRQASSWAASFPSRPPLEVSVNVSARQFDSGIVAAVAHALDAAGLGPGQLWLEVTESIVMRDVEAAVATLEDLKGLGASVSIDDFGTGYSSLAYLRRLPLDEIKVDKSFVDGLGQDPEDTAIVAAVVGMSHALDLVVVAEGVETDQQLDALRTLGCEYAQGYYFARPGPPEAIESLVVAEAEATWAGHQAERRGPVTHTPGTYRARRVIVADDTPEVVQLARLSLTTAGFEVHEAHTGEEALALTGELRPDCVILDVMMPDRDGFEVCRALRADPEASECTIVMLTATSSADSKAVAFLAGADDYIVKPFAPRDLVSRVRAAMSRRPRPLDD